MAETVLTGLDAEFLWQLSCFWLTRIWDQSSPSTEPVPEKMRIIGGERVPQMIVVSTVHKGMGDAIEGRVGSRGGCAWFQIEI